MTPLVTAYLVVIAVVGTVAIGGIAGLYGRNTPLDNLLFTLTVSIGLPAAVALGVLAMADIAR